MVKRVHLTRLVPVLVMLLCVTAAPALGKAPKLKGAVRDPRGDAFPDPQTGERPDVKRVSVTYYPTAGVIKWRVRLWSPAPTQTPYILKALRATRDCSPSSPTVFYLERAAAFPLRIEGVDVTSQNVAFEREIHGARMTETWSGPELRGLDFGCITGPFEGAQGGEVATGIFNVGIDYFEPFKVHRAGSR